MTINAPKKLIEVALPLDDINAAAAREKSIRHGHPSTLHLWWARRPLAVLFAQLVNDPGGERGYYAGKTKAQANAEREKLFDIVRDLVKWENTNNEEVLERARAAIRKSWRETCELNKGRLGFDPDKLPAFHDPFAGGGAIPLEAQRLGLEAYASDLNPVAVLINKAMIEIPPKFAGSAPVGPVPANEKQMPLPEQDLSGARGLAEDVRRYGHWMREQAEKRIGQLYPKVAITPEMVAGSAGVPPACGQDGRAPRPDLEPFVGQKLTVIAWLWARTVKSPNPAFSHVEVPLVSSFVLSTKKGKEAYVEPVVEGDSYRFEVRVGRPENFEELKKGTKLSRGANFRCILSGSPVEPRYIKAEGKAGRMGARLIAVVAEGKRGRIYLSPTEEMEGIARQAEPGWKPGGAVPERLTGGTCYGYGLESWGDLFTPRQLLALTTFSDLVQEARKKVIADYLGARASRPQKEWHSRGYLPHWEGGEIAQSITFRLDDSLPREQRAQWEAELSRLPEPRRQAERRKRIEAALDAGYGACHLKNPEIAEVVESALRHFDGERYRLHAWCIMPNHVHVLVTPLHGNSLSSIVHSWKSFSAKRANRLLGRSGAFWMEEYFDRAVRDQNHFDKVVEYIRVNPVKAGLCDLEDEWRWSGWEGGRSGRERAGRPRSQDAVPLAEGGAGATAYGDAVAVYLAFAVDRLADRCSTICSWDTGYTKIRNTFGRQAIPMTWDYAEGNVFSDSTGNFTSLLQWVVKFLNAAPAQPSGTVLQQDAPKQTISTDKLVSIDPPYYDNIGYADLSDFFYVWLRRSLKSIYPDLFATMAVPKAEELVATPYRHGSREKAEQFFMTGMSKAIHNLAEQAHPAFPVTIYYAYKQSETKDAGTISTGWETFLEAVIRSGFSITGTWPMRTEMGNRMIGSGTNALASSIILVCRKRPGSAGVSPACGQDGRAPSISRRQFQRELREQMPEALEMMIGGCEGASPTAPVDLAQAAIGPGMAIFSRYSAVLNQDGSAMSVHDALILINREITEFLTPESGRFDNDTLFCSAWFDQYGWSAGPFGVADTLARAKGTSVDGVRQAGVVTAAGGKVQLRKWEAYPAEWDPEADDRMPVWEACHHMIRALNRQSESEAGALLAKMPEKGESIRQLAYHLYTLCERKKWAEEARAYNELIASWHGIVAASHEAGRYGEQTALGF